MTFRFGVVEIANSALIGRGGGLIYDDVLDVTWLQDANLAKSESFGVLNISIGGGVDWYTAINWIDAMNAANYMGYGDWHLPKTMPVNGLNYDTNLSYNGSTDRGFNISAPGSAYPGSKGSELAYMFYNNLNCSASRDMNGNHQPGGGILSHPGDHGFTNLTSYNFWSGTDYPTHPSLAFKFGFFDGAQIGANKSLLTSGIVWAVRDGDVAPVPIPSAVWLLGSGLIGLVGFRRKLRRAV